MKKLFKHSILPALFALLLSTTSCVADMPCLIPDDDGTDRSVTVRLAPASITTRGVSRPICHGEPVQFNQGMMYLVTSTGAISRYFPIIESGGAASNLVIDPTSGLTMSGTINIDSLKLGKDIGLVPSTVARVVIVGNSQGAQLPTSGNINSIISGTNGLVRNDDHNTIATQFSAFTPGVNMFANYPLLPHPTAESVWYAEMTLAPTVARFEIAKMTGMGMIHSYSVDGIFIDRYIRQATRDGNFYPGNNVPYVIRDHLNSATNFDPGAHDYIAKGTPVAGRTSGALFTSYIPALPAAGRTPYGVVARPAGTHTWTTGCLVENCCPPGTVVQNAWSFQMFARDFGTTTAPTTTPPVIIVRLTNVYVRTGIGSETQYIGTQYLTIAHFDRREAGGTGFLTPLEGIRASNVYHIANLVFNQDDLYVHPYPTDRTIRVEVEVSEWNGQEIHQSGGLRQPAPMNANVNCFASHTFNMGVAICGCITPNITYQWEQSLDGVEWTIARAFSPAPNFTTPALSQSTYFRRVARCGCNLTRMNTSPVARVSMPGDPRFLDPNEWVEIGDINGTPIRWATRNLYIPHTFTLQPHILGSFFQFSRLPAWSATNPIRQWRYDTNTSAYAWLPTPWNTERPFVPAGLNAWPEETDPCPAGWRVPNMNELDFLHDCPNFTSATADEASAAGFGCVAGAIFGTYPNQVFLPAGAARLPGGGFQALGAGCYWSSTAEVSGAGGTVMNARRLCFNPTTGVRTRTLSQPHDGFNVRCVRK